MLERKSLMHLMMNLQQGINYQDFIVRSELKEVKKFFLTQQLSEFGGFFFKGVWRYCRYCRSMMKSLETCCLPTSAAYPGMYVNPN